mmetsp:Transcript_549/g.1632  ORF Transcript_549/g.1632 Transcript_549/m.1632 type:complete len:344 (-) Transcript_549:541-1572(-)
MGLEEHLDLGGVRSGSGGNAVDARPNLGIGWPRVEIDLAIELLVGHGVHNDAELLEALGLLVLPVLRHQIVRHAGDHPHHLVERAHPHDVLELRVHVPEGELSLGHLLPQGVLRVVVVEALHLLDEAADVAVSQQLSDEALGVEGLEVIEVLPGAQKDDGRLGGGHGTDGPAALGMSVELGNDDGTDVGRLVKGLGLIVHGLALGGIHHKHGVIGPHRSTNLLHLVKQGRFLPMSTRRIDQYHLESLVDKLIHPLLGNRHRIGLGVITVERHAELGGVLLELIERPCPERVTTHHAGPKSLAAVVVGHLGDRRGLAGTLQPNEQNDVGSAALHLIRTDVFARR